MSRRMDWVPCENWGVSNTVPAATQSEFSLLSLSQYFAAETEGRVDTGGRMFLHRIVGSFTYGSNGSSLTNPQMHFRLWPGLVDASSSTIYTPGFIDEVDAANARFWWERRIYQSGTVSNYSLQDPSRIYSPMWGHIDVSPKQVLDENIVPIFSMLNNDINVSCRLLLYLRLLVSPLT